MQSDSVLCVHTRKNTHSQATAATVIFPTVARLVLQVTLCCWSWAEAQIQNDSPWPPAHPEKWMQGFIITGSTQHIIDPNKDPHVQFKRTAWWLWSRGVLWHNYPTRNGSETTSQDFLKLFCEIEEYLCRICACFRILGVTIEESFLVCR